MFSKFVSIDIETTGSDFETCDVIEIGAVIDDWLEPLDQPPTFHCYIDRHSFKGQTYALSMHPTIFRRIATKEEGFTYLYPNEATKRLSEWMRNKGAYEVEDGFTRRANVAGKNFAMFDDRFLKKLDKHHYLRYRHRVIDPAMMYWDPFTDSKLPDLKTCMERAGIDGEVAHTALEDAIVVTKLIQRGIKMGYHCG